MSYRVFSLLIAAGLLSSTTAVAEADLVLVGHNDDVLSSASGDVQVELTDTRSRQATLSNTSTGESVSLTLLAARDGEAMPDQTFFHAYEKDQSGSGDGLLSIDSPGAFDSRERFDLWDGEPEGLLIHFESSARIDFIEFADLAADEYVDVFRDGARIASLSGPDQKFDLATTFQAGQTAEFRVGEGNFQIDRIGFSEVAVPEPSLMPSMAALCLLALCLHRGRNVLTLSRQQ